MYTVYAMKSKWKNYIYVGMNVNLLGYLKRHNDGREKTIRLNRPFELIYKKFQLPRKDARSIEKNFKFGLGKEFLRRIS